MTKKKAEKAETKPAAVDTKALAKAADSRWQKRTDILRERRKGMAGEILQYRYDVGLFAVEVIEDKTKETGKRLYGSHTVNDICADIGESASTVHSCIKFVRKVDTKELDSFKKHEFPWRAVASLITVEDAKSYKALKEKFEKGAFDNSDQLKSAVKDANAESKKDGTKADKRGGNSTAASMVKSFNTMLNQATSKVIPGLMKAVTAFVKKGDSMSETTAEAVKGGIKEAKKNIIATRKLLDKADAIIKESGV